MRDTRLCPFVYGGSVLQVVYTIIDTSQRPAIGVSTW